MFEPARELLPDSSLPISYAGWPFIVCSDQKVYLFFVIPYPPFFLSPVQMFISTDGGTSFSSARDISPDKTGEVTWATISGDTIALIYPPEPDLYRRILRSSDGGATWTEVGRVGRALTDPNTAGGTESVTGLTVASGDQLRVVAENTVGDTFNYANPGTNEIVSGGFPTTTAHELLRRFDAAKPHPCGAFGIAAMTAGRPLLWSGSTWLTMR